VIESDFGMRPARIARQSAEAANAWFWEKGQKLPHAISDNVYSRINNQVKVSSFLS